MLPADRCRRPVPPLAAGAAGFKDVRFLDLFFSRLRPNDTGRLADRYPFVSPCGREMNYVAVEDVPVVFKTLTADGAPARPAATSC